ncbi:hypothetical protein [Nonomuraea dietziae]|uniref:hypothetical protein n=1 Tax=Nonomuraea dietziae TaxID=65515 RepID=UPI0033C79676
MRATQAALFRHAILPRWNPVALGPTPTTRPPDDLTPARARDLAALAPTDHVSATALSLHLNLPPTHFGCFRCGDFFFDGSRLATPAPQTHPPLHEGTRFYAPTTGMPTSGTAAADPVGPALDADTLILFTVLSTTCIPLTVEELAVALTWTLNRVLQRWATHTNIPSSVAQSLSQTVTLSTRPR